MADVVDLALPMPASATHVKLSNGARTLQPNYKKCTNFDRRKHKHHPIDMNLS
jgi:hypothetical protein